MTDTAGLSTRRRLSALLLVVTTVLFAPRFAWAQDGTLAGGRKIPIHLTATVTPSDPHPGEVVTATVKATIDEGWHLYAPSSAAPKDNPTTPSDITTLGDWQPAAATSDDTTPVLKADPNFQATVAYHEGSASLSRQFRVPDAASSTPPASVSFHYQTCNSQICLPPTTVELPVSITAGTGAARPEFTKVNSVASPVASASSAGESATSGPLFFLLAAGAGLLALVTPCVFPLIPITLASFVKQADGDKKKLVRLAIGYALGVAGLYVAVGGVMSIFAGASSANRLASNPYVNLFAFGVFVVFALSFFETVQIAVPGAVTGAVQGKARSQKGWVSLALLGIVFVLASFTCTAPFVGTLMVASAGGERIRPLLGMTVFALFFTSPFLLFAAFPQSITKIPKSGAWLARVKATLGFIELAAALKFLSNADQVWQWKLITTPVLLAAWALLFTLASLYLVGLLRFGVVAETETGAERIPPLRGAFAGLFAAIALYCFWGLSGRPMSQQIQSFLPPAGYGLESSGSGASRDGLAWLSDYDEALAKAKSEGKLLFIDFTGYTCANCRWNESNVFPDAGVKAGLAKFVRVQLYVDDAKDGTKNLSLEETKFKDVAQPLYGIIDPATGNVVGQCAGVQTIGGFTAFLNDALAKAPAASPLAEAPPASAGSPAEAAGMWQPYSDAALAAAKAAGKPVVIDFTANWCVNCKQIEREVFEERATKARLGSETVTLRGDLTKWASPESKALQKKWGFGALPTIILLDRTGNEIKPSRITGRLSVADFNKRLDTLSGK